MTDILQSPSHLASSSSSITPANNDGFHQHQQTNFLNHETPLINVAPVDLYGINYCRQIRRQVELSVEAEAAEEVSVLAVLVTVLRNSLVGCKNASEEKEQIMEIGWPTNVRHIAHVTFDRFHGFLGLPVEFEPQVPRRPPSASTRVFGVSTESMQLSFDPRGNCIPTILLMMQRRLYLQGGLQSEGIFRINPENGQEEYVRENINNGVIPENIDVHCLAGLLKAWFRELPSGILDPLPPEEVMEARSEEECSRLVGLLPPTEAALLDWAINLMADVAQFKHFNKMNARNIAMVFAPNMTKMSDPLTALMYAVQVMNFLKTLVVKTLREREECAVRTGPLLQVEPSDHEDGHYTNSRPRNHLEANEGDEAAAAAREPLLNPTMISTFQVESRICDGRTHGFLTSIENLSSREQGEGDKDDTSADIAHSVGVGTIKDDGVERVNAGRKTQPIRRRAKSWQSSNPNDVKKRSSEHICSKTSCSYSWSCREKQGSKSLCNNGI